VTYTKMVLKFKKLVAAAGVATIVLSLTGTSAFASSDATASVVGDGDAYTYTDDSDELLVANEQDGWLANADLGIGVSGANVQEDSDDENSMGTGDAEGTGQSDNFLNSNVSVIEDVDEDSSTADSTVGEDGDATSEAYDNDYVEVSNSNGAWLENLTLGVAVSGYNNQSGNDDGNTMDTGSSDAMAEALNEVNSNWTVIGGSHSAHATSSVGDDGDAYAYSEDDDEVYVYNNNAASVQNASIAFAFSGGNVQSYNDDDNELNAGPSSANSSANNFVNSNVTVVGGEEGNGSATSNSEVGEDGDATAESYDNDLVTVENSNEAEVENVSVAAGVSGYNNQSNNDDGNSMTTGNASGNSCSTNTVNSNWTVIGGTLPEGENQGCAVAQ
jgi:hypothetical protein